jgi:hypothetical protein
MSENYEFALNHVTGEYVMYLGDDDGLLPNACNDVSEIINSTGTKALIWNKPSYNWPTTDENPNQINLHCCYDLCEMNGHILLRGISVGKTSYGRLPVIYSGFVSMSSINNVKIRTGNFFHSVTPDVYSGIVLAEEIKKYLYSFRPFSINGQSPHSTGYAIWSNNSKAGDLINESSIKVNQAMPLIRGSIITHVTEAFLQAKSVSLLTNFQIDFDKIHFNIFKELKQTPKEIKLSGLENLKKMTLNKKNRKLVEREIRMVNKSKEIFTDGKNMNSINIVPKINGYVSFNCATLSINNSYDACQLCATLLGKYQQPLVILKVNYFSILLIVIKRSLSKIFFKFNIPV